MRYLVCIICLWLSSCSNTLTQLPEGIQPVSTFSLDRYLGTWYEIARLDHSFERNLSHVTAQYELNSDGSVKVTNRGYHTTKQSWKTAIGKAMFVGEPFIGHLKVSFFGPFYASYVVFQLDPDYQTALVTSHDSSYVWLLSRTPALSSTQQHNMSKALIQHGFDTDSLIWVNHNTDNIGSTHE